jgi:hypothetical protein
MKQLGVIEDFKRERNVKGAANSPDYEIANKFEIFIPEERKSFITTQEGERTFKSSAKNLRKDSLNFPDPVAVEIIHD